LLLFSTHEQKLQRKSCHISSCSVPICSTLNAPTVNTSFVSAKCHCSNAVYTAAFHKTPGNRSTFTADTIKWRGRRRERERKREREREKKVARAASVSEGPVLESQPRDRLSDSGVRGSNQQCLQEDANWKSTKSYATNVSFRTLGRLLSTVILSFDST